MIKVWHDCEPNMKQATYATKLKSKLLCIYDNKQLLQSDHCVGDDSDTVNPLSAMLTLWHTIIGIYKTLAIEL